VREKALAIGACQALVQDVRREFVADYVFPALQANAVYEGVYPLATALARPLIGRCLVETARRIGAAAVAHGCTGKGNDQVRLEAAVAALAPEIEVLAPVRDLNLNREAEMVYAERHGIPVEAKASIFSIDENLWGQSIECGPLEDESAEPPEAAFSWTTSPLHAPQEPEYIEIGFSAGIPTSLNGAPMDGLALIQELNCLGGVHGVGRVDHIESRLVGIKSREVYEAPAATILLTARRDLEKLVLTRDVLHYKAGLENAYGELVYNGLWFSPLRRALQAFFDDTRRRVNGTVRLKLYKGAVTAVGRSSAESLYHRSLATYGGRDEFRQEAAKGFIDIWTLPLRTAGVHGTEAGTAIGA